MPAPKGNQNARKPDYQKYKIVGIALSAGWWQRFTAIAKQKNLSKPKLIQQWIERDEKENKNNEN